MPAFRISKSLLVVCLAATGGAFSGCEANSSSPSSNSPIPVITGLEPNAAPLGGPAFTLTVQGTNFVAASLVTFDRTAVPTTFVSATHLTAAIPAAAIATAGTELMDVYVSNPLPGGRSVPFPIVMLGLSANPGALAFGNQTINTTSAAMTITLTNMFNAVEPFALGINSRDFAQTNNCPAVLVAGASCTISVTFTPSATGTRGGTLSIGGNDDVVDVHLNGIGIGQ
jgi:hypothetical protein